MPAELLAVWRWQMELLELLAGEELLALLELSELLPGEVLELRWLLPYHLAQLLWRLSVR
jgi:hypothetical protein